MTTILIIEDDEIVRKLIRKILSQKQYEVLEAAEGQGGVRLAMMARPDLIICDVMMPGIDGYGVLQQLQSQPETAMIPFIFLTACAERQDIRQGMRLGADDYLTKPFTKEDLLSAIAARLSKVSSFQQHFEPQDINFECPPEPVQQEGDGYCDDRFRLQEIFEAIACNFPDATQGQLSLLTIRLAGYSAVCAHHDAPKRASLDQGIVGRLTEICRQQGWLVRLAEDQFCALLSAPQAHDQIEAIAQAIVEIFQDPLTLGGEQLSLPATVGIAQYPADADNLADLVAQAQAAQGPNGYQWASRHLPAPLVYPSDIDLAKDLQNALRHEQLTILYQPQFDLGSGAMVGAETLLHWEHPLRGAIPTPELLAIAKDNNLLDTLDQYKLNQICRQLRHWQIPASPAYQIMINLSAAQFNQANFHQELSRLFIENALTPACLTLEFAEATLLKNPATSIRRLKAIKTLGVKIALTGFGQGYSSLDYLKKFPFDYLKLDPALIRNLHQNQAQKTLVSTLITAAHGQQRQAIAEGIEHQAELDCLRQLHCDYGQGFLLGHPIDGAEFERLAFDPIYSGVIW
ncbi:EAL domain-containing protein [Picosynechococcus sp. NKBG15041c]|uniref:two-component system response regulator n=1 Tax=Picosynechococcus sp. NKBG15041c TaxID=1407650 RepID=UPI00042566EE|nr:EAL domain-containing protein [Picosynechococcus sp. NKBG15041c]